MTGGIVTIVTTPTNAAAAEKAIAMAIVPMALSVGTRQCFSLPLRFALYPRTKLMAKYPVADDCIHLEIFGVAHNGYNGRFSREGREEERKKASKVPPPGRIYYRI